MKYVTFVTKGLEFITVKEIIATIGGAKIIEENSKRIIFETEEYDPKILQLKTVDDIHLLLFSGEIKNSLQTALTSIQTIDFIKAKEFLNKIRESTNTFSITTSIVGRADYSSDKCIEYISNLIVHKYSMQYTPLDHTNFDIRIFVDHTKLIISIRLTKESLYKRSYKSVSRIGSLKPTVAASMVMLMKTHNKPLKLVDNFCGSGTILCEALNLGFSVYGGDIDTEAVLIAQNNLKNLYPKLEIEDNIKRLNAVKTNWPPNFFDVAVSNLPWGKQIKIQSLTNLYRDYLLELKRIIRPEGEIRLLVSNPQLLIKYAKMYFPEKEIKTYSIGLLGQNPALIYLQ